MPDPTMPTPDEWPAAANVLGVVSTLLDSIDWDALAAATERADSLGPILYPSECRATLHNGTLARNRRAVQATRTYLAELRAIHEDQTSREERG